MCDRSLGRNWPKEAMNRAADLFGPVLKPRCFNFTVNIILAFIAIAYNNNNSNSNNNKNNKNKIKIKGHSL